MYSEVYKLRGTSCVGKKRSIKADNYFYSLFSDNFFLVKCSSRIITMNICLSHLIDEKMPRVAFTSFKFKEKALLKLQTIT